MTARKAYHSRPHKTLLEAGSATHSLCSNGMPLFNSVLCEGFLKTPATKLALRPHTPRPSFKHQLTTARLQGGAHTILLTPTSRPPDNALNMHRHALHVTCMCYTHPLPLHMHCTTRFPCTPCGFLPLITMSCSTAQHAGGHLPV